MADQDYGNCDCCGKPFTEDDDFAWRADLIHEALEDADDCTVEVLLAMFMGRYLSGWHPSDRKKVRASVRKLIDEETRGWVIRGCDA